MRRAREELRLDWDGGDKDAVGLCRAQQEGARELQTPSRRWDREQELQLLPPQAWGRNTCSPFPQPAPPAAGCPHLFLQPAPASPKLSPLKQQQP